MQNIPIRGEQGKRIREIFVAPRSSVLVSADYSQIDLRCVAHVAKDREMIRAFNEDADIHTFTAASVHNVDAKDVTKAQRSSAKELNFGLIYGMGAQGFARSADISMDEARTFIDAYFKRFSGVKKYMDDTKDLVVKEGYVETLLGRRRVMENLDKQPPQLRAMMERAAINMPIQGLAADIMKLAMIAVFEKVCTDDIRMVLQVHDEIILEVPQKEAARVAKDVKSIMEGVYTLSVPLVVDVSQGKSWAEL